MFFNDIDNIFKAYEGKKYEKNIKKTILFLIIFFCFVSCSIKYHTGYFTVNIHNPNSFDLVYTSQIIHLNPNNADSENSEIYLRFEDDLNKNIIRTDQTVKDLFYVHNIFSHEVKIQYAVKDGSDEYGYTGTVYYKNIKMALYEEKTVELTTE